MDDRCELEEQPRCALGMNLEGPTGKNKARENGPDGRVEPRVKDETPFACVMVQIDGKLVSSILSVAAVLVTQSRICGRCSSGELGDALRDFC